MIAPSRGIESLKVAARWPGADRATVVTLATRLASVRADAEGYAYFQEQADAHPGQALPLALAGFFQARLGADTGAALAKLDRAAEADLGPPQFFRGLALAALPARTTARPRRCGTRGSTPSRPTPSCCSAPTGRTPRTASGSPRPASGGPNPACMSPRATTSATSPSSPPATAWSRSTPERRRRG